MGRVKIIQNERAPQTLMLGDYISIRKNGHIRYRYVVQVGGKFHTISTETHTPVQEFFSLSEMQNHYAMKYPEFKIHKEAHIELKEDTK